MLPMLNVRRNVKNVWHDEEEGITKICTSHTKMNPCLSNKFLPIENHIILISPKYKLIICFVLKNKMSKIEKLHCDSFKI